MSADYRFFLRLGKDGQQQPVRPDWADSLSIDWQRESGQMFSRPSLSGSLDFIREDYALIMTAAFNTEFFLDIEMSLDNGETWAQYFTGRFMMTDCTVNMDDRKITVKPETYDRYNGILAAMDKTYDIIKLAPAIQPVTVIRRPMIQVYVAGESMVTCVLSAMSWEQDVSEEVSDHGRLTDDYHFGKVAQRVEITFQNAPPHLGGTFVGSWDHWGVDGEWNDFSNGDTTYKLTYFQETTINPDVGALRTNGLRVRRVSDDAMIYEFAQQHYGAEFLDIPNPFTMEPKIEGLTDLTGDYVQTDVYGRLVMATDTFNNIQAFDIPSDDIVENNRNYRYCYPFPEISNSVVMTTNNQADPTEWGIRPDGKYYLQPTGVSHNKFLPIGRSRWSYASIWFNDYADTEYVESMARKSTLIRDAFTLEAVLSVLLKEADNTITFAGTDTYSQFLYGTNPLVGTQTAWGRLVMTPKSNILTAEYTQPARKAEVTLKDVLTMLKEACGLYWFIDDDKRLRIEHVSWFKNGGSYSGTPEVGLDITKLVNSRNGKTWDFGTNTYSFDKPEMTKRYEFGWMDDCTQVFANLPIDVVSPYVTQGRVDEVTVAMFNSDIDYMMLNPSNVSQDGFALMCCQVSGTDYSTTISRQLVVGDGYYTMQNWQLAFAFLELAFLISDMPAWTLRINGTDVQAKGIQRKKRQTLKVPVTNDPDVLELVHTGIGNGEIQKMGIRLTSRMANLTLGYATE